MTTEIGKKLIGIRNTIIWDGLVTRYRYVISDGGESTSVIVDCKKIILLNESTVISFSVRSLCGYSSS